MIQVRQSPLYYAIQWTGSNLAELQSYTSRAVTQDGDVAYVAGDPMEGVGPVAMQLGEYFIVKATGWPRFQHVASDLTDWPEV